MFYGSTLQFCLGILIYNYIIIYKERTPQLNAKSHNEIPEISRKSQKNFQVVETLVPALNLKNGTLNNFFGNKFLFYNLMSFTLLLRIKFLRNLEISKFKVLFKLRSQ